MTAEPPHNEQQPPTWAPTQSPTILTTTTAAAAASLTLHASPPSNSPIDFSPPLIAMVIVAAAAFLLVTFSRHFFPPLHRLTRRYRHWRRRRRLRIHFPSSDVDSFSPPPPYESSDGFYVYSPYGLDDSVIKKIPLTIYKPPKSNKSTSENVKLGFISHVDEFHDCAVCLLEFEDGDYVRTLPICYHSFHVDCIDIWLKSHATCPLCRTGVFFPPLPESPLTPLMAARIRPSLDLESAFLEPLPEIQPANDDLFSPDVRRSNRRELDFLLKRSHSFSFERSFPSERLVLGAATTPHRHHQHNGEHNRRRSFWMKRPSSTPFSSAAKSRVFSFRLKSPSFFRRRGFFPTSESSASMRYGIGSSFSMKSVASPVFGRPGVFSSSRMRLGDPEALISPDRYGRQ